VGRLTLAAKLIALVTFAFLAGYSLLEGLGFKAFLFWLFMLFLSQTLFYLGFKFSVLIFVKRLVKELQEITGFEREIKVLLIDSPEVNAFATKEKDKELLALTTALVLFCNLNELRFAVAHEFSHLYRRHLEKAENNFKLKLGALVTSLVFPPLIPVSLALWAFASVRQRNFEHEADEFACKLLKKLNYSCEGGKSFLKKVMKFEKEPGLLERIVNFFTATHPSLKERFEKISKIEKN
jgi:Zn-dependent protease with chaperone function